MSCEKREGEGMKGKAGMPAKLMMSRYLNGIPQKSFLSLGYPSGLSGLIDELKTKTKT